MTGADLAAAGGAVGAVLRHAVYLAVESDRGIPRATLLVNVVGSFVLGAVVAWASTDAIYFLGVGVCGAFTTFSTFSVETVDALEAGDYRVAAGYAAINLAGALGAVALAWWLVAALTA